MPLFYFHVHDGVDLRDNTGTECADLKAAKSAALVMSGRLLAEQDEMFWNGEEWSIDIEDEAGKIAFSLKFAAVDYPD